MIKIYKKNNCCMLTFAHFNRFTKNMYFLEFSDVEIQKSRFCYLTSFQNKSASFGILALEFHKRSFPEASRFSNYLNEKILINLRFENYQVERRESTKGSGGR